EVFQVGLFLRYNLFYSPADAVYEAFAAFYGRRGSRLQPAEQDQARLNFYREHNGWAVVDLGSGWEWKVRREAQLFVSQTLWCPGFLIFVYDGDYWGYEFFSRGEVVDCFVQEAIEAPVRFPDKDCGGDPRAITEQLPFL